MPDINTLRTALFETLEALKSGKMDLDRAKAINETAQTIINTAKVEVEFMKIDGTATGTGFLKEIPTSSTPALPGPQQTATGIKQTTPVPGGSVTTHQMR